MPDDPVNDAIQTVEFNIEIKSDYPRCSFLTPYPGTGIAEYVIKKGLFTGDPDRILASSQQYDTIISGEYKNQIMNIHSFFQTAVLFPWTWKFIKKMIKFPSNFIFLSWWAMVYFLVFIKGGGRSFFYTLIFAIRAFRSVFEKSK